jgi:hypothetical protein
VLVHDLIHVRAADGWTMRKSSYRKLRVSSADIVRQMEALGFKIDVNRMAGRMWAISAHKPEECISALAHSLDHRLVDPHARGALGLGQWKTGGRLGLCRRRFRRIG